MLCIGSGLRNAQRIATVSSGIGYSVRTGECLELNHELAAEALAGARVRSARSLGVEGEG